MGKAVIRPDLFKLPTLEELNEAGEAGFVVSALTEGVTDRRVAFLRLVGTIVAILEAEEATIDDFAPLIREGTRLYRKGTRQ